MGNLKTNHTHSLARDATFNQLEGFRRKPQNQPKESDTPHGACLACALGGATAEAARVLKRVSEKRVPVKPARGALP